ncbi:MAG: alpha-amylase family protein [Spirochaetales bacterium]
MYAQPDISRRRILESLKQAVSGEFQRRFDEHFAELYSLYRELYGSRPDCIVQLQELVNTLAEYDAVREADLKSRDTHDERQRAADTEGLPWYQRRDAVGAMCYADRFAGTIRGIDEKLAYLEELGITYLHIMPPFLCPETRNDGGYAVSSYRDLRPDLGTIEDIDWLSRRLHDRGIRMVLDFVFNHTSDEHEWAQAARRGDPRYLNHYFVFPDRRMPDRYNATLREIFPERKRGSFIYDGELDGWVWSTFNPYQWDLNYSNPQVLTDMVGEMLALANRGVDVLRLDALAFTWKELGTACENLPRVHTLIRLFHVAAAIVAPSVEFKSEAIVHPDDVLGYIDEHECRLSYNPLFMALSWEALATKRSTLLVKSLQKRYELPANCAWINYVRSHDDIGWTFSDEDARELGIDPFLHRSYLNRFYTGRFPGSFARGVAFQLNPATGDCRICGTGASLAGIEQALSDRDEKALDRAVRRFLLVHAVIMFARGLPVLYLGDEYGQLNDYSYIESAAMVDDSRWVHRPLFDPGGGGTLLNDNVRRRIRSGVSRLIEFRKTEPEFDHPRTEFSDAGHEQLLVISRPGGTTCLHVICNLGDRSETVSVESLPGTLGHHGAALLEDPGKAGKRIDPGQALSIEALRYVLVRTWYEPST